MSSRHRPTQTPWESKASSCDHTRDNAVFMQARWLCSVPGTVGGFVAELMGDREECGGCWRERQENDSDRPGIFLSDSEETAAGSSVDSFLLCLSGHTLEVWEPRGGQKGGQSWMGGGTSSRPGRGVVSPQPSLRQHKVSYSWCEAVPSSSACLPNLGITEDRLQPRFPHS